MRILNLTHWDYGACGYFLSDAINRYTDHESRVVCQHPLSETYLRYPRDISAPDDDEVRALFDWCDVVHVHDVNPYDWLPLDAKPVVISYNGTMYRRLHARFDDHDHGHGWVSTVSTLDLTLLSSRPHWLPCARPDLSEYASAEKALGFHVVHAPTKRQYKSTDDIVPILHSLESDGITFDVIEGVSWRECLERKARGHLLIDQFMYGIGCNAVEAWLTGMPVISNGPAAVKAEFAKRVGYVPFTEATIDTLRETILRFKDDADFYRSEAARGESYANDWHSQSVVAAMAVPLYEQAIEQFQARQRKEQPPEAPQPPEGLALVLLEYIGGNQGMETIWGPVTNQRYEFGGIRPLGYVDERDVRGLTRVPKGRKRAQFRRREE
jgi:hypothetical protein